MSKIQLAISPLTWSNDDMPELGGEIALETCLSEMRQAGFTGTEMGAKYPRDPQVLLPLLQRHGLRLASGWCSGNLMRDDVETEWKAIAPHVALLRAAGVKAMVYGEVRNTVHGDIHRKLSSRVVLGTEEFRRYGTRLTALAERLLSEHGIRLAFHHHVGTIIETPQDVLRLLECTGEAVGLTFDSGHAAFGGADPAVLLRELAPRVAHVHFKDVRPAVLHQTRAADKSFLDAVLAGAFTVPGDGAIAFEPLLTLLGQAGYEGWIVVEAEQDPALAHPLTYARLAHRNIADLLAAGGYSARDGVWEA
ncbi:myo-inosose-2 dehydratase [Thiomonas sp. FB-6]|uniref:myo-inosose-2 dehydratase n=1 Tax=Thiomonas sp. FB-6 TaxID=1158291 RepID=UPI000370CE27|nr:myo-inosose-2 dehydratase [Thiomonas sp. FB-6]